MIKSSLTSIEALTHYNPNLSISLACDASSGIFHTQSDGKRKVIAYASCRLSQAEKNYAQIQKEVCQSSIMYRSSVSTLWEEWFIDYFHYIITDVTCI